ncbi:solute carrier family 49 member A3-like isoform X2 [Rhopilema esculentum]|uniref:solute carrier family 49 member A3-like isoform X2 n=1 Tax=Rhopilema esculentum TaxID=499914 RepID=UPI0031D694CF
MMLTGTWINAFGCITRLLASFLLHQRYIFWMALVGQAISACSQPIILAIPTKLAALWFADNERTVANTLASLANPLGVLIASAFSPIIVKEATDMKLMLMIFSVPSVLGALMTTFGVCSDAPPTPPSASAHLISEPFLKGVKMALKSRSFILLMFVFGFGVALFSTITSLLEQIICPRGYDNDIAGLCGALVIVGGLLFSGIAGVYVDKTKRFEETAKVFMLLAAIMSCLVLVSTSLFNQTTLLCIVFFLFGATCLGVAPICLELGVECTYPVDEATSAGLQWMFGQFIGVFLMLGLPELGTKLTPEEQQHSVCNIPGSHNNLDSKDLTNALISVTVVLTVIVLIFVIGFKAEYKRLYAEIEAKTSKILYRESPDDQEVTDFPTA